jgi:uncharacterized protein YecT (DUF1311 family)
VREIVGVDAVLNQRWSTRRLLIKDRQGELAAQFRRDHGRPPMPVEALQLAQHATLETRDAKHEPAAWPSNAPPGVRRPPKRSAGLPSVVADPATVRAPEPVG